MAKFEVVNRFKEDEINLPKRGTCHSAGYDFEVAEDITIPSYQECMNIYRNNVPLSEYNLDEVATITKDLKVKPTLVPTGIKCSMAADEYLELSVRSSTPLKYWIVLANGIGIIDSDYYGNESNDGEIFFQVINLLPHPITLCKGNIIGQGIIKKYYTVENDTCSDSTRVGGFGSTTKWDY